MPQPTIQWGQPDPNVEDWVARYIRLYQPGPVVQNLDIETPVAAAPVIHEDYLEDEDDLDALIDNYDDDAPLDDDEEPIIFTPRPKFVAVVMFDDGSEEDHSDD